MPIGSVAYGVGRRSAMDDVRDLLPVWEYSAVGDDRTRASHRALDGVIYPADHPFWDQYYPPWDFGCRCTVIPLPSIPKGYYHAKPNGIDTVEYDDAGLPSRSVVDGRAVSLRPGKFRGIPRRSSLAEVIRKGATRAGKSEESANETVRISTSEEADEFGKREFPDLAQRLTGQEADSIFRYTSTSFDGINDYLRGKKMNWDAIELSETDVIAQIKHLDSAIARFSLRTNVVVYRGFGWDRRVKKGQIINDEGFVSTSVLKSVADGWPLSVARENKLVPTIIEFVVPKGTNALFAESVTAVKEEYELLLARGQKLEILSTRKEGDVIYAKARLKR